MKQGRHDIGQRFRHDSSMHDTNFILLFILSFIAISYSAGHTSFDS